MDHGKYFRFHEHFISMSVRWIVYCCYAVLTESVGTERVMGESYLSVILISKIFIFETTERFR